MRFIHTADWHLGKSLKGRSLLDDQEHILKEFMKLVEDSRPQAVVIAGDIYDRGVPPTEAVELFDEVLTKLLLEKKVPVLYISGNHDSAKRIHFGSKLFVSAGLYVRGELTEDFSPVVLEDEAGPVYFSLIPYAEPNKAADVLEIEGRLSFEEAHKAVLQQARRKIPKGKRSVAVSHAFLAGGITSESERPLSVGGADNVPPALFKGYSYTAMGHLHGPQRAGADNIRYSGSLLKYSFDEANQKKGVTLVDMAGNGKVSTEHMPLTPLRDVMILEGMMDDLMVDRTKYPKSQDYVMIRLLDANPVLNPIDRLGEVYPNILAIERKGLSVQAELSRIEGHRENRSEENLFIDFYKAMTNQELNEDEKRLLEECILEARREEGELE